MCPAVLARVAGDLVLRAVRCVMLIVSLSRAHPMVVDIMSAGGSAIVYCHPRGARCCFSFASVFIGVAPNSLRCPFFPCTDWFVPIQVERDHVPMDMIRLSDDDVMWP